MDCEKFSNDIKNSPLLKNPPQNLDELVDTYNTTLSNLFEDHAPLKSRSFVERPLVPWMTDDIKEAKKKRKRAEKKWQKTHLEVHRQIYKSERQNVRKLIKDSQTSYFQGAVENCAGDQAKLFKLVNSFSGNMPCALPDHTSVAELASRFNNFFISKINTIRSGLDTVVNTAVELTDNNFVGVPLSNFKPATQDEISKILKKCGKATCALDPMPTKLLVEHFLDPLLPTLTDIINKSMALGYFPDKLKQALVRPLLKKPSLDSNILKNYRPVSNLAFVSKLIEKVVSSRLFEHMSSNNLHETFQSAFKPCHSTETALLRVHNDILCAVDKKQAVYLVLLDLSAAFDTIDHNVLIDYLRNCIGLTGLVLDWFVSYLKSRKQSVFIDGVASLLCMLLFGVPQGSVLGPLLFCIYILPLGKIFKKHDIMFHIYADDTQIYISFSASNTSEASNRLIKLQNCIHDVRSWMTYNKLKLNDDKTEFLVISSPYYQDSLAKTHLRIGNSVISPSKTARNLGVMFDNVLNVNNHITLICKSASFKLYKLGKIRNYLTQEAAAQLIHAFVTSRLDYCNSLLFGLPSTSLYRLQRIQNIAARILTRTKKFDHITPVLKSLHWLPIHLRIKFKILLLCFRIINGLAPAYLSDLLTPYKQSRTLRSSSKSLLFIPESKLKTYGDRSFACAAPLLWNNLPLDIRDAPSLETFKSNLKTHLFSSF